MHKFLVYFSNTVDIPKGKLKQFIDRIPQSIKPRFMSIYESILREGLKKGLKKGLKEGEEKGLEKGVDLGVEKNKISVIIKGYENNVPLDTLAMLTELSVEQVKKIIETHLQGKAQ